MSVSPYKKKIEQYVARLEAMYKSLDKALFVVNEYYRGMQRERECVIEDLKEIVNNG